MQSVIAVVRLIDSNFGGLYNVHDSNVRQNFIWPSLYLATELTLQVSERICQGHMLKTFFFLASPVVSDPKCFENISKILIYFSLIFTYFPAQNAVKISVRPSIFVFPYFLTLIDVLSRKALLTGGHFREVKFDIQLKKSGNP